MAWTKAQQAAWAAQQKAVAAEKQAKADAARSAAEAKRVEAETKRIKAAADARARETDATERAAAAAHKRKMEESGRTVGERVWQIGSNIGTYAAGVGGGYLAARGLSKKQEIAVKASAQHLDRLASDARKVIADARKNTPPPPKRGARTSAKIVAGKMPPKAKPPVTAPRLDAIAKAQLGNIAASAKDLKLMKLRAPMGAPLLVGAALVVEGAFSRFYMADRAKTDGEREAWNVIGNVSMAAGATIPVKSYANGTGIAKSWSTTSASSHAMIKTAAQLGTKPVAAAVIPKSLKIGGGLVGTALAIGYAASQTEAGKKAIGDITAWVKGFTRQDPRTGKIETVKPHYRTIRREKWRAG